jgi:hypothetical protein
MELSIEYEKIIGSLSYECLKPGDKVVALNCVRDFSVYPIVPGNVYVVSGVDRCGAYDKELDDMCSECKSGCPSGRIDVKLKVRRRIDAPIDHCASCGWELQTLDGRRLIPAKKVE